MAGKFNSLKDILAALGKTEKDVFVGENGPKDLWITMTDTADVPVSAFRSADLGLIKDGLNALPAGSTSFSNYMKTVREYFPEHADKPLKYDVNTGGFWVKENDGGIWHPFTGAGGKGAAEWASNDLSPLTPKIDKLLKKLGKTKDDIYFDDSGEGFIKGNPPTSLAGYATTYQNPKALPVKPPSALELGEGWPVVPDYRNHQDPRLATDPESVIEAMREMHGPTRNLFATAEEEAALMDYVGSGYRAMNRAMRYGGGDEDTIRRIQQLDQILARSNLLSPLRMFRGLPEPKNPRDFIGVEDPGFGSWSTSLSTARSFATGHTPPYNVMVLDAPAGVRGIPLVGSMISGEHEVILPRSHIYDPAGDPFTEGVYQYFPVELRNKYAKGGKVSAIKDFLNMSGLFGENSQRYKDLIQSSGMGVPHSDELKAMEVYANRPWGDPALIDQMLHLTNKYGILIPPDVPLHRGISMQEGEGDFLNWQDLVTPASKELKGLTPVTPSREVARGFTNLFSSIPADNMLMSFARDEPLKALPIPHSGQDELLLAPAQFRLTNLDVHRPTVDDPYARFMEAELYATPGAKPKYAKGGKVSAIEDLLRGVLPEDRARLEAVLNEEPNLERVLSKKGAEDILASGDKGGERIIIDSEGNPSHFTEPSPIALMEPERFRSLAMPTSEGDLRVRGPWIAHDIEEEGLNDIPYLGIDRFAAGLIPQVQRHEGRGRSRAMELLGLKKMPVFMEIWRPEYMGLETVSDKIRWLREHNRLIPESHWPESAPDSVDISDIKMFAKGGKVTEKKKRKNNLKTLSAIAAAQHGPGGEPQRDKQLFLHGILSQLYGLNGQDEPAFLGGMEFRKGPTGAYDLVPTFTGTPGIVDELLAMPTILPEDYVPEFSKEAQDRLERLNKMVYEDMNLEPPKDLKENMFSAAGTMATQLPTGGVKAAETAVLKSGLLGKVKRAGELLGEWFTPTVDISPASYGAGTAIGAVSQQLADEAAKQAEKERERMIANAGRFAQGGGVADLADMKRKYAKNETKGALRAIQDAIAAIESGDRPKALEALRPHKGHAAVAEVLQTLGDKETPAEG